MLELFTGVSGILASLGLMEAIDVQKEFQKLYFDLAGNPEPVALDMLWMVTDDNRIVYGSYYPHSPAKVIISKKKHLENNPKYKELLFKIYGENEKIILNK